MKEENNWGNVTQKEALLWIDDIREELLSVRKSIEKSKHISCDVQFNKMFDKANEDILDLFVWITHSSTRLNKQNNENKN